ncbi:MAG: PA14 domain-containing protein [Spirosomataceae bacterium]
MRSSILIIFLLFATRGIYAQSCLGTPGQVTWRYWLNMPASNSSDTSALYTNEKFPSFPDGFQTLASLQTPVNFTDNFAASMRAFIKPIETASYRFNITGDDRVVVYFSETGPENKKKVIAQVLSWTGRTEHTKSPEQTSALFNLTAGQTYYIEIIHLEGSGGDHASLYWQKSTETAWQVVDFRYLIDYACWGNCPPVGTPCNDGDPTTSNDVQDGNCHCIGEAPKPTSCVGKRGGVEAYYYDNIPGSYVENDLLNAPQFPLVPSRKEYLPSANGPLKPNSRDQYGSMVQGYLTVPVSGNYQFNLTGDNQTMFFLSKNHDPAFLQTHQLIVVNGLGEYQHGASRFQSTSPLFLEKGKYYYFEILHKENTSRDFFQLFWQTPFGVNPQQWRRIPGVYLFDYTCELACVPAGTPCDDGNALTNDDKFDGNCNCTGTPCSGPDCADPRVSYQPFADCLVTDNLVAQANEQWLSCQTSGNPNPIRTQQSHWIEYQFDQTQQISTSRIWNYNVANETSKGFRDVLVDYSEDGTTWKFLGQFTWPEAPGQVDYAGFKGPDFQKKRIKKVLFTALNTYGDLACAGFGKMSWEATVCEPSGTPCDDGDPLTIRDEYNSACECRGIPIDCRTDSVILGRYPIDQPNVNAVQFISSESTIANNTSVAFTAGKSIVLLPGFEVAYGGVFSAKIEACIRTAVSQELEKGHLTMLQDTSADYRQVIYQLPTAGRILLQIKKETGEVVQTLFQGVQQQAKTFIKWIPTQRMAAGKYQIVLSGEDWEISQDFHVDSTRNTSPTKLK